MRKIFILVIVIKLWALGYWPNPSYAARPLATEDAGVAGKGAFQIEVSEDYAKQDNNDKAYTFLFVPIYGLTERIELSAEFPYVLIRPKEGDKEEGLSDINLVLKTLIIPEGKIKPAFLLKTQVKLSNGDEKRGLGSGDKDVGFVGVTTKILRPFTIHANFGYTFVGRKTDGSLKDYILYGIACEYSLNKKIKIAGELYGESDSHFDIGTFKHHNFGPLIGLTYQLTGKIILDTAFYSAIADGKGSEYGLTLGISY